LRDSAVSGADFRVETDQPFPVFGVRDAVLPWFIDRKTDPILPALRGVRHSSSVGGGGKVIGLIIYAGFAAAAFVVLGYACFAAEEGE
jgi:hypothetical protein